MSLRRAEKDAQSHRHLSARDNFNVMKLVIMCAGLAWENYNWLI